MPLKWTAYLTTKPIRLFTSKRNQVGYSWLVIVNISSQVEKKKRQWKWIFFCKKTKKKWNEPLLTVLFSSHIFKALHQVNQHQHLPIHIHRSSSFPLSSSSISFYAGSFVRTHAIFLIYYPFPALLSEIQYLILWNMQ